MWKYILFREVEIEVERCAVAEEGGIGSERSQVVSAFRWVRRGRRVEFELERERVMESWRVAWSCWEGSSMSSDCGSIVDWAGLGWN